MGIHHHGPMGHSKLGGGGGEQGLDLTTSLRWNNPKKNFVKPKQTINKFSHAGTYLF